MVLLLLLQILDLNLHFDLNQLNWLSHQLNEITFLLEIDQIHSKEEN